ncbi:MAG: single-stranded-DNA-specific exonuclease RecJ, partial [Flavisolibacter sp.]|nr:single-stranded-DNA-specific exonuclease RecJ [Flavisolibacter sp.]
MSGTKRWNLIPEIKEKTAALFRDLKIHPAICNILAQRGINNYEEARLFFRPQLNSLHDPFLMKDMDKAVNRILQAFSGNEKILVFGDYDVDGTTS